MPRNRIQAFTGCQHISLPVAGRATTTVQAPQSPSAQPSFEPVSRFVWRSQFSSVVSPRRPDTVSTRLFSTNVMLSRMLPFPPINCPDRLNSRKGTA